MHAFRIGQKKFTVTYIHNINIRAWLHTRSADPVLEVSTKGIGENERTVRPRSSEPCGNEREREGDIREGGKHEREKNI